MDKLRDREARLHDEMAAAAADHERVLELDASLRALRESATARAPLAGARGDRRGVIAARAACPGRVRSAACR